MITDIHSSNTCAARTMQVLEFLARRTLPTPTMIISSGAAELQ